LGAAHLVGAGLLLLSGCAVELGGRAGFGGRASEPVHFVESTGVAASTLIRSAASSRNGVHLGGEVESRFEAQQGSRWTTGLQLGFARAPDRKLGSIGLELHADVGTQARDGVLFRRGSAYTGASLALPIWLFPRRQLADVNTDPWLLSRAFELIPLLRGRAYFDNVSGSQPLTIRYDVGLGLALRTRFVSDLL
jgi:hypothetical protein